MARMINPDANLGGAYAGGAYPDRVGACTGLESTSSRPNLRDARLGIVPPTLCLLKDTVCVSGPPPASTRTHALLSLSKQTIYYNP